jgi:hypothetical protein
VRNLRLDPDASRDDDELWRDVRAEMGGINICNSREARPFPSTQRRDRSFHAAKLMLALQAMRWSGRLGGSKRWRSRRPAATRQGAMMVLGFDVKKAEVKMLLENFFKDVGDEVNYEEILGNQ